MNNKVIQSREIYNDDIVAIIKDTIMSDELRHFSRDLKNKKFDTDSREMYFVQNITDAYFKKFILYHNEQIELNSKGVNKIERINRNLCEGTRLYVSCEYHRLTELLLMIYDTVLNDMHTYICSNM